MNVTELLNKLENDTTYTKTELYNMSIKQLYELILLTYKKRLSIKLI